MNTRRKIVAAIGASTLAPRALFAQQARKVSRVGILSVASTKIYIDAFLQGMRDLGYVEGTNLVVETRHAEGKAERLPGFAAELVQLKVDVILAPPGTPLVAKAATTSIPIVIVNIANPVGLGLVASLARPGGNITGISNALEDSIGKTVELLVAVVPKLPRVALLLTPGPLKAMVANLTQSAAARAGVGVASFEAGTPAEIDAAFDAMVRDRLGGLIVSPGPFLFRQARQIAELAVKTRIPAIYTIDDHVTVGGLMSYGPKSTAMYRQAARHVDKILKGTKPADIPVEQPTEYDLVVNLAAARNIGVKIPQTVLLQATRVIE